MEVLMKKWVFCITALLLLLSGCGSDEPKASAKAISCGEAALEISQQYIDREIEYSEIYEELEELSSEFDYIHDLTIEDSNKSPDTIILSSIHGVQLCLMEDHSESSATSYDELLESIDDLQTAIDKYK